MEKRIYHVESLQFKWYFKQNNTDSNGIYHLGISWAEQRSRAGLGTSRACSTGYTSPPSEAVPWKPGSSQASLWSVSIPQASQRMTPLIVPPSPHYSIHPKSSCQLASPTKPSSYKSTQLSQRLQFHKQPHPSHFLSGVLWRILFILHLSWLYCKLFRSRAFCVLCLHCWKHVASATQFRAVKARRDQYKYLSWPSAQCSNSRKWVQSQWRCTAKIQPHCFILHFLLIQLHG